MAEWQQYLNIIKLYKHIIYKDKVYKLAWIPYRLWLKLKGMKSELAAIGRKIQLESKDKELNQQQKVTHREGVIEALPHKQSQEKDYILMNSHKPSAYISD